MTPPGQVATLILPADCSWNESREPAPAPALAAAECRSSPATIRRDRRSAPARRAGRALPLRRPVHGGRASPGGPDRPRHRRSHHGEPGERPDPARGRARRRRAAALPDRAGPGDAQGNRASHPGRIAATGAVLCLAGKAELDHPRRLPDPRAGDARGRLSGRHGRPWRRRSAPRRTSRRSYPISTAAACPRARSRRRRSGGRSQPSCPRTRSSPTRG